MKSSPWGAWPTIGLLAIASMFVPGGLPRTEASGLQDPERIDKLEKRVAELEAHVQKLEMLLKTLTGQLGPAIDKAIVKAKAASCANNLRQLWTLEVTYTSQFGGRLKAMPAATGPDFWIALTKTKPPLIDDSELEVLVCPLSGKSSKPDFTTYRGPSKPVSKLTEDDAVGCCEPGQHPDGTITVLKKSGDVATVGPSDPLYKRALETTTSQSGVPEKK